MRVNELKPGMLLKRHGLVTRIDLREEVPHFYFIDSNDAYWGECSIYRSEVRDYEILYEQGTPEYNTHVEEMLQELRDHLGTIRGNIQLAEAFIE